MPYLSIGKSRMPRPGIRLILSDASVDRWFMLNQCPRLGSYNLRSTNYERTGQWILLHRFLYSS